MKRKPELYTKSQTWLFLAFVLGAVAIITGQTSQTHFLTFLLCLGVAAILEKLEEKP